MIKAYTLVRLEGWGWQRGSQKFDPQKKNIEIAKKITQLHAVKEAVSVYGDYDLIVKTETESLEEMDAFIYNHLRKILGVAMTTTLIVAYLPEEKMKKA